MLAAVAKWRDNVIKPEENEPFLNKGRDFINDSLIENLLAVNQHPDPVRIRR